MFAKLAFSDILLVRKRFISIKYELIDAAFFIQVLMIPSHYGYCTETPDLKTAAQKLMETIIEV